MMDKHNEISFKIIIKQRHVIVAVAAVKDNFANFSSKGFGAHECVLICGHFETFQFIY